MGFGLYASPDYVAAHGAPASAGELRDHRVIDWLDGFPENAVVLWLRRQIGDNIPVFSTNPASARLAAARMGVGIALVPCMVAENLSGVVRLLPDEPIPGVDLWLLVHRDLVRLAQVDRKSTRLNSSH